MGNVIEMVKLDKRYQDLFALSAVSAQVPAGKVIGLLGHNGAGKSTLIKLVLGLIRPTCGRLEVLGASPVGRDALAIRRRLGYLPETVAFYGNLTGREVMRYLARLKQAPAAQADRLLERVGLAPARDRRTGTYSKGMRQRLGLAQALLGVPELVLLDEPTSGLDPQAQQDFYAIIEALRRGGCSVLVSSHVLTELEPHIDIAMILHRGRLAAMGTLEQLRRASGLPQVVCVRLKPDVAPGAFAASMDGAGSKVTCQRDGRVEIEVDGPHKLQVLRELAAHPAVSDVTAREASLARLYGELETDPAPARECA
ncbi:MAG: ABC transporter ATP-binding protein [Rhodanobacteraceae bacterium]|nr:MAG: ABC transporter ATP-binding protein [Rhodanobacteraceae bacterium]